MTDGIEMKGRNKIRWHSGSGDLQTIQQITEEIVEYANKGCTLYVGADSMLIAETCVFAVVIALHDRDHKIAKYFYRKIKKTESKYKDIKLKILEEVNLAVDAAHFILEKCPEAKLEIHVDISTKKVHKSSTLYSTIKGWVAGLGIPLKVKPDSWASSSIADWHTK